ncbi:MAG: transglutaminase-like domain-containing protein [Thermodesulfobacteriota bacterium]
MDEPLESFLEPAEGIQCAEPEVLALARQVARGSRNDVVAAQRLFEFVRDTVRYSVQVPFDDIADYLALNTLARGWGYCVQKSALLCALARSLGIPARLGYADIRNQILPPAMTAMLGGDVLYYHCFAEWWIGGQWCKATPSFDRQLTEERGWRLVEFVPGQDLLLPATDLAGRPHVSYLRYHGWRREVPLAEMRRAWVETMGEAGLQAWRDQSQGPVRRLA